MQAITTRFIPPTNTRGTRVAARCDAGRVVIAWDDAMDVPENHDRAARALLVKLGWRDAYLRGSSPDGRGYAYVCENAARVTRDARADAYTNAGEPQPE